MTEQKQVEVLAPAGSYESMEAAFAAGADAAYIGGSRFGARAYADNPDEELLCRAIDYAHLHGRRLYMTVNTLVKEQELKELPAYLLPYYQRGLDSVIVQDLGAMALIRDYFPDLPIHASTQMTITGVYGARKLKELGASRIVTARELSLEEIHQIHQQVDVEIESFVHGALCYCYSGQCLMSSLIGGRSGNRGRCAQPCRLPYEVKQGNRKLNGQQDSCVLSMKDLCTLDLLPDILEAGVYSLKIEGRMKSPRYTAGAVSMYRKYVDRYMAFGRKGYRVDPEDKQFLLKLFDRGGFTQGYYTQHNGRKMLAVKEKPEFREVDQQVLADIDNQYRKKKLQEPIRAWIELTPKKAVKLLLENAAGDRAVVYGQEVQAAQNRPVDQETICRQMQKTGNTPFYFEHLSVVLNGDCFLPVQALNTLRRMGLEELEKQILSAYSRQPKKWENLDESVNAEKENKNSEQMEKIPCFVVSVEEQNQLPLVLDRVEVDEIYLDADGFPAEVWKEMVNACHQKKKKCRLLLPEIFRQKAIQYFEDKYTALFSAGFDGLVVRNLEEAEWIKEKAQVWAREQNAVGGKDSAAKKPFSLVFDASLYTWNNRAVRVMEEAGADRITVPAELNGRELRERGITGQEILVYGRLPMMVSAQCIRKTVMGCDEKREILHIKDRMGKEMPVKNRCRFCYNTIYNGNPLSLLGQERLVEELRPGTLRLHFTDETPKEVKQVLEAFTDGFCNHRAAVFPLSGFTRGHIKRGVE